VTVDLSPLAHEVMADLCEHPRARADDVAQRLGQPREEVYSALVQLYDRQHARIVNSCGAWRRDTGRSCLWSPA
jgi:hypothetical protein